MYMEDEMKEIIDNFKEKGEKTISLLTGESPRLRGWPSTKATAFNYEIGRASCRERV